MADKLPSIGELRMEELAKALSRDGGRARTATYGPLNTSTYAYDPTPPTSVDPRDIQIGGDHYKTMAIQPSTFIMKNKLDWLSGNAIKYICRHHTKGGKVDLEKAKHYIDLLIKEHYE